METGHYRAFCKVRNQWFVFDDSEVKCVLQNDVSSTNGYVDRLIFKDTCVSTSVSMLNM